MFSFIVLDCESGEIIGESEPDQALVGVLTSDGVALYSTLDSTIVATDLLTMEAIWKKKVTHSWAGSFAAEKEILVYTCSVQNPTGTVLDNITNYVISCDSRSGEDKWKFTTRMTIQTSPVIYGNRVFFGCNDQYLYSLDLATGRKDWRFFTGGKIWDSPGAAYNMVFFGSRDDYFYALDARSGQQIWKKKYPSPFARYSHPVIADSLVIYSGRDSSFYAVDAFTGKDLWKYKLDKPILYSPALYKGRIYMVCGDSLYALE